MNILFSFGRNKYRFKFVGLEVEDQNVKADIRTKQLAAYRTIDEMRKEDELEPFNEDWSNMPLNPYTVQIYMGAKQQEQQEQMQQQQGGMPGGDGEGGMPEDGGMPDGGGDDEWSQFANDSSGQGEDMQKALVRFQKSTDALERKLRIVIE